MKHFLFLLMIFPRLKSKRALSEAKKSIKQTKNTLFHACSENEPKQMSKIKLFRDTVLSCAN